MKKHRGVNVGRKLLSMWRWVRRRSHSSKQIEYTRLRKKTERNNLQKTDKPFSLGRFFLKFRLNNRESKPKPPPKGYLAVHLAFHGWENPHRAVVPIDFFNHPLFGELLKEAEKEFGFDQSGAITIPCPVSDFEGVCTAVAADVGRRCRRRSRILSLGLS